MKIGRLHVRFNTGRRWHTQSKWPDGDWRTDYFETDDDWGDTRPETLEWVHHIEETFTRREILVAHRVVSCYQIKFTISYRTFWFEVSNNTRWKWWTA